MAFIGAALPYITAGMSVASTIADANTQEKIAGIQAQQLEDQSIADTAMAVQDAKNERKRSQLLQSRVTALAAKSGMGQDVDRTLSEIDQQGSYNSLAALYSGATSATSKKYAATAAKATGKSRAASGYMDAGSTILSTLNKQYG